MPPVRHELGLDITPSSPAWAAWLRLRWRRRPLTSWVAEAPSELAKSESKRILVAEGSGKASCSLPAPSWWT